VKVDVIKISGEKKEEIDFPEDLFGGEVNKGIIWEAVEMYRANARQGTASTKTRGEVRGGGRKPWRQKHTGRARHGSIRSPIWRGGGVTFGPRTRDYSYSMPKRKKRIALIESVKEKLKRKEVFVVEDFTLPEIKTRLFADILRNTGLSGKDTKLFVVNGYHRELYLSSRNIPTVRMLSYTDLNAWEVWRSSKLVFTKKACEEFIKRCRRFLQEK